MNKESCIILFGASKNDEYMKRLPVEEAVDFLSLLWGL